MEFTDIRQCIFHLLPGSWICWIRGRNFHTNASIEFGTGFASFIEIAVVGCTSVHIILITCFIMKLLSVITFLFNSDLTGNVEMHFISDLRRPLVLMGHGKTSFPMFVHFCASVHYCTTLSAEICSFLAQVSVALSLPCSLLIPLLLSLMGLSVSYGLRT